MINLKIILTDTNPNSCAILLDRLSKYDTQEIHDIKTLWELVKKNPPDLIILDTDMSGTLKIKDTCKKIIDHFKVPVIVISGNGSMDSRLEWFECGICDYIIRPFSPKEIVSRIENVLKRTQHSPRSLEKIVLPSATINFVENKIIGKTVAKSLKLNYENKRFLSLLCSKPNQEVSYKDLSMWVFGTPETQKKELNKIYTKVEPLLRDKLFLYIRHNKEKEIYMFSYFKNFKIIHVDRITKKTLW